ncbi:hypothetical protein [Bradyrhizobium sp. CCBAU 53421]|uniref:hypothetical protein n=1 Tax=Bradyrhizobium sp. CCBAU 53421 TaxID=1325120 RepID=UPI00188D3988|nr:hypothetical protein [Bradyrhizobium sp. CCBAU 53421]
MALTKFAEGCWRLPRHHLGNARRRCDDAAWCQAAFALVGSEQHEPSAQAPSRGFGGVTSAAAEMLAAIVISAVATNLFRIRTVIVSARRYRIVRNAE